MKKKLLAMFDLDGTLFDTDEANFEAYRDALAEFKVDLDRSYFIRDCMGRNYKDFLPSILEEDYEVVERVHLRKKELYSQNMDKVRVNKTLFSMIDSMKDRYFIAVVTTASRRNTEEVLNHFGYKKYFDLLITQEDITKVKPDPECFLKAMQHFGISPENSIIFEDSEVGIQAARSSGASVYIVDRVQV